MRIALVSDCYPPRMGGIESQVSGLAHALQRIGHDVTVITATASPHPDTGGPKVVRLALRLPGQVPVNPFAGPTLRRMLPLYDVVHIHMGVVSPFARMAVKICAELKLPTVLTWHCLLTDSRTWYGWVHPLAQWAATPMSLTSVSHAAAQAVQACSRFPLNVKILPNLIDTDPWESARQNRIQARAQQTGRKLRTLETTPECSRNYAGPQPLRLVTATRLAGRKRVVPFGKTILRMQRAGIAVRWDVYGVGPDAAALSKLARQGAPIRLHGRANATTLAHAYERADAFVSPVVHEAFGIAALEARACGLPVLARSNNGIADFITSGVNGALVDSDEQLEAAIARLVRAPRTLNKLQEAALKPVDYTWKTGMWRYVQAYENARVDGTPNRI
ncbi:glycosyltransferase family 4 protein [Gleimia hominis]|uniref:glycosyltransferase family 4 protein n=1 Tax=Gleimia hominis TaxID=595468 RepID=UPI000C7FCCB4|nr:glycosyltransferase family 4 protein [Gleimia hominis]WIK65342.1 glycosyltransferase family 4 protein [Gleimia hominis]